VALNVRGTEQLQALPGEAADTAWARMRARLPFSGKQLDEVKLMQPVALPGTGGSSTPTPAPSPTPAPATPAPQPGAGTTPTAPAAPATPEKPPLPPLFGGAGAQPNPPTPSAPPAPKPPLKLESPSTSTLNQLQRLTDTWAIKPKATLSSITLTIPAATLEQLQDILKKMPTELKVGLSLEKDDE
jgi:hypothetical protein